MRRQIASATAHSLNEYMPPVRRNYEGAVKMASQTPQSIGSGHLCALGDLVELFARIDCRPVLADRDASDDSQRAGTSVQSQKSAIVQVQSPNQSGRH